MGAAILRAVGDSKRPLYYLIVCCFVNIGLDLLFVVVLKMEVAGAALATILSQLLSAALVMWTLMRTKESFRFELKYLKVDKPMLRKIIQIGFPAGLQSVLYSISNVVIQANINSFGTNVLSLIHIYAAGVTKDDCVLEIGPGIGTMTQYLAENARQVVAVEIDRNLIPILGETLAAWDNVTIINEDILKVDIRELADRYNGCLLYTSRCV